MREEYEIAIAAFIGVTVGGFIVWLMVATLAAVQIRAEEVREVKTLEQLVGRQDRPDSQVWDWMRGE